MKWISGFFFMVLLAGCAAPIQTGAERVRQIDPQAAAGCKHLRLVEVEGGLFYSSTTEARRDMLNKLRNATLAAGGNAFAAREIVVERGFSLPFGQADAYNCPL
jgi:hypothetical protein